MKNEPDIPTLMREVRREIAVAKLVELDFQSHRLGELVTDGLVPRGDAADTLYNAALANGLIRLHGEDVVQAIIADGLGAAA